MVEKVPEFSAESLCLRQGMLTSGRWCHMTLLDHVTLCVECFVRKNRIHLFNIRLCNNKDSTQYYLPTVLSMKEMERCMDE